MNRSSPCMMVLSHMWSLIDLIATVTLIVIGGVSRWQAEVVLEVSPLVQHPGRFAPNAEAVLVQ